MAFMLKTGSLEEGCDMDMFLFLSMSVIMYQQPLSHVHLGMMLNFTFTHQ